MGVRTANVQPGDIGETLESLAVTILGRLLTDVEDELLKKLAEESSEVIMA